MGRRAADVQFISLLFWMVEGTYVQFLFGELNVEKLENFKFGRTFGVHDNGHLELLFSLW